MKNAVWALAALTMLFVSCHAPRQTVTAPISNNLATMTPQGQYQALAASYQPWEDAYMPVTLTLNAPAKVSISGRATLVRDKEIYISLRMLGFEVAQIYVTADSVYALEKIHKYYLSESLDDLLRGADLTVGDMQSLLLGQAFVPGKGVIDGNDRDFKLSLQDERLIMAPKRAPRGVEWSYACQTGGLPSLEAFDIEVGSKAQIDCAFSGHQNTQAGQVARVVDISAQAGGRDIEARVRWDLGDARWNEGREIKFKRPSGYKRIAGSALLKILGEM